MTVDHLVLNKHKLLLSQCFQVLKRRMQLNRFMLKRETVLASKVIYQWQLYCKLQRIRSRYGEGSSPQRIVESREESKYENTLPASSINDRVPLH